MNYNTNKTLWQNFKTQRDAMPNGGAILNVFDGMIGCGSEVIARFSTQADAINMLKETGFKRVKTDQVPVAFK